MDLKTQMLYVLAVASLAVGGMAQTKACESLDGGPYLGTVPTLNFMIPEASDTDLLDAERLGSKKYYSELRIFGNPTTDFNLTVSSNIEDPFEYFTVVTEAGTNYFKLIKPLDRDGSTSSPEDDVNLIPFTLTCQPSNASLPEVIYDARIFITDVNDNIPIFPKGNTTLNFTISEATPVGTTLFTAVADDKDAHLGGNITYTLQNFNNSFSVDNMTGAVMLTSELDYESLPSEKTIALILTAQDSELGVTYTVTATATIHVTDADDQGPAFIYPGCFTYKSVCAWPKYTTGRSLKKDQPIQVQPVPNKGQGPVTIKAADLDVAIGNKISFSIASTIPPGSENMFRVDTTQLTGNEYTASVVPLSDMTVNEGFEIFLTATEQSLTMKHEMAMILFTGTSAPVDDNSQGNRQACESLDDGPYLGTVPTLNFMIPEASDTDLLDAERLGSKKYFSELRIFGNPTTDFKLTVSSNIEDPFEYFTVVTEAGTNYFKLIKPLDRDGSTSSPDDDVNLIPFTLTCQPSNASLPQVIYDARIFITDVNDNIPIFPKGNNTLNFTFSEATPVGITLFTAVADDKDAHLDGNITYTLQNFNNLFSVDNMTGAVTLTSELDYESLPSEKTIALILTAQDSELGVTYTVTATATIHVTDADDQGPAFIYPGCFTYKSVCAWPKYTAGRSLKKDQPIQVQPVPNKGQGPVTIKAADLDVAIGNRISFSIASTIPPGSENKFRVDTTQLTGNEYAASVVPLSDMTVNEGFEIFLTATEQSLTMKHEVAMILFTETSASVGDTSQGIVGNKSSDDDDAGYSKLEVALIVVVAILATFLLCVSIILVISCWRNSHKRKQKSEYSMSTANNGHSERL